jgi:hypothetical protein
MCPLRRRGKFKLGALLFVAANNVDPSNPARAGNSFARPAICSVDPSFAKPNN